jgi:hypothetical protein
VLGGFQTICTFIKLFYYVVVYLFVNLVSMFDRFGYSSKVSFFVGEKVDFHFN